MAGLSVHSVIVSCPYDNCDSLQTIPIKPLNASFKHGDGAEYIPCTPRHVCTKCGREIVVQAFGVYNVLH